MTYATALKHAGINLEKTDKYETYEFWGTTKSGKHFYLRRTCHNTNQYWVIDIDGKTIATRCCFRTALKKIKAN